MTPADRPRALQLRRECDVPRPSMIADLTATGVIVAIVCGLLRLFAH